MHLGDIRIFQRLHKSFPILSVLRDVASKEKEDCLIVSFGLTVGIRMVRRSLEVFNAKIAA